MIGLKIELKDLPELRRRLDPAKVDKALARAMKSAAGKEATQISKDVRAVYAVKAKDVKSHLTIRRMPGTSPDYLLLYISGALGLNYFSMQPKKVMSARGRRIGVSVKVRKSGPRKLVKGKYGQGGFVANVNGPKIFERIPGTRMKDKAKAQIERKYGPSIPVMISRTLGKIDFSSRAGANVAAEFERQIRLLLDK